MLLFYNDGVNIDHDVIMYHSLQMWLGNSSRSTTIGGLVLEHLCPTIQNILQDGLRDHKLDLIIGQRRNHAWNVVEAFTHTGQKCMVVMMIMIMWGVGGYGRFDADDGMAIVAHGGCSLMVSVPVSGPTTRVLHSLLSKVRQCSLLTSHCMKLRAFIMGLLK